MDEKDELIGLRRELAETKLQLHTQSAEMAKLKEVNTLLRRNQSANATNKQNAKILDAILKNRTCRSDPDHVISFIRNKTINMFDVDSKGRTLLLIASKTGGYGVVNLCLNLGGDLNHKDNDGHDAIYWARHGAWFHIEQLLLLNKMNANIGNRINETANRIKEQQGIIQNICQHLSSYDSSTTQFFKDTMIDLMTNIINKKLSFSDDLLYLCWQFESENSANPLSSKLWKTLMKTCDDIIQNGNKTDWHWLKTFIVPSTIWLQKETDDEMYLYFKLVKLVEQQATKQLSELKDNLNVLANKNQNHWDELIKFDIAIDHYDVARQDMVPNGIAPKFTFQQLSEQNASSASFNSHTFYDYNEYLPELLLLAQIVDENFQKSIQDIFSIDKGTNTGHINTGTIRYIRGPVKLMDRARSKASDDYNNEEYPTSACILDLNRCSLVFNDIATLLSAMRLFTNKIKYYQSGCVIDIVRVKNGFQEYVKSAQYADIKLNVLIKGKSSNIIGEVQFLLGIMKEFKAKSHNLYALTRQKDYYETSVSSVLPILLDHDKQLFVAANMGNIKALCDLMVINNFTQEDIMKVDEESNESILVNICDGRDLKTLQFLQTVISNDLFIEHLFVPNRYNATPIEYAMGRANNDLMIQYIFSMKEIELRYDFKNHKDTFWRLIYCLFSEGTSDMIEFVMNALHITNEQIIEMMVHKYTKTSQQFAGGPKYHDCTILNGAVLNKTSVNLEKLASIIGHKTFGELVFNSDGWNVNAVETAIGHKKLDTMKYLLSFDQIRSTYANQQALQWRLLFWLFARKDISEETIDYMLNELNLSNAQIVKLLSYKYTKTTPYYHNWTILSQLARNNTVSKLRKLVSLIGEKAFIQHIFIANNYNVNGLEYCIRNKNTEMMKYIMTFDEIRGKCSTDMETKFRIVYWMNRAFDISMCECIVNALKLQLSQLKELQSFKCSKPKEGQYATNTIRYRNQIISDEAISKIMSL